MLFSVQGFKEGTEYSIGFGFRNMLLEVGVQTIPYSRYLVKLVLDCGGTAVWNNVFGKGLRSLTGANASVSVTKVDLDKIFTLVEGDVTDVNVLVVHGVVHVFHGDIVMHVGPEVFNVISFSRPSGVGGLVFLVHCRCRPPDLSGKGGKQ